MRRTHLARIGLFYQKDNAFPLECHGSQHHDSEPNIRSSLASHHISNMTEGLRIDLLDNICVKTIVTLMFPRLFHDAWEEWTDRALAITE